jgi:hypothetical protein
MQGILGGRVFYHGDIISYWDTKLYTADLKKKMIKLNKFSDFGCYGSM